MLTKLVVNADDFGYSNGVNYGIIDAFNNGVLTSTTLMANMPGFEHAVNLAKANSGLGIGVHLNLTIGYPIIRKKSTITDIKGSFLQRAILKQKIDTINLNDVYDEWEAQIKQLISKEINLTHLDTHHYVHSLKPLCMVIEDLANLYHLPIRNSHDVKENLTNKSIAPTEALWSLFNYSEMKKMNRTYDDIKDKLLKVIEEDAIQYSVNNKVEANCHPGYMDTNLFFGSSFNLARMREVELLCDVNLKKILLQNNYQLCRYDEL